MIQLKDIKKNILSVLKGGDILFIVPPFSTVKSAVIGVHILQSLSKEKGYKTEILYLNILLAAVIGVERFEYICLPPFETMWTMLHERLFARSAHGLPPLGKSPEYCLDEAMSITGSRKHPEMICVPEPLNLEEYFKVEEICNTFIDDVIETITSLDYKMIGCTARMGQTNCSVAVLNGVKRINPDIITLIGGTDCRGELAKGIASLSDSIDYIFSGDSEISFSNFLQNYSNGKLPDTRIITGNPLMDLDTLPLAEYGSFLNQKEFFIGNDFNQKKIISYETSRGCWWGAKCSCNFCSEDKIFRQKTSQKVLCDLKEISMHDEIEGIHMCDLAMPLSYHEEVVPKLLENQNYPTIYYQAKANMDLHDLINLKKSKIDQFTIGIETFSNDLLKLINKGTTLRQNLKLLRNARSVEMLLDYLILWGFPGDKQEHYQEVLNILPLIRHLQPPITCLHMILSRFSPYFEKAEEFQVTNIQPWAVYKMIFPEWTDFDNMAYWFIADYPCEAHENPQLMKQIGKEVDLWRRSWKSSYLVMVNLNDSYLIFDNRDVTGKKQYTLDYQQAKDIMTDCVYSGSDHQQWAVKEKLGVFADSWYVPLITASPELLLQFE